MKKPSIFLIGASIIVLLLCSYWAQAQDRKFGDWIVGQKNDVSFAKTANDSNDELHKVYTDNGCNWLLHVNLPCSEGASTHVLINSGTGSAQTTMICFRTTVYKFADSGLIDRIIDKAAQVSVAIPLGNGLIRVSRFSLTGATEALSQLACAQGLRENHPPTDPCKQLRTNYFSCKSKAEKVLQECTVWPGPGPCPYSVPNCVLPSTINPRCTP